MSIEIEENKKTEAIQTLKSNFLVAGTWNLGISYLSVLCAHLFVLESLWRKISCLHILLPNIINAKFCKGVWLYKMDVY